MQFSRQVQQTLLLLRDLVRCQCPGEINDRGMMFADAGDESLILPLSVLFAKLYECRSKSFFAGYWCLVI